MKWRLFNVSERRAVTELDTQAAVKFLAKFPYEERNDWYAWTPGLPQWVRIACCHELQSQLDCPVDTSAPPVFPPTQGNKKVAKKGNTKKIDRTQVKPAAAKSGEVIELRKHARVALRLKAVLIFEGKTFRTFTQDVSLGGFHLEREAPWDVASQVCEVYLSLPDKNETLLFQGRAVGDKHKPRRFSFSDLDEPSSDKLKIWLELARNMIPHVA